MANTRPVSIRAESWRSFKVAAWLGWLFVHIFFLIGFRNRLLVMIDWAWSYLTFQRSARLITNLHSYAPTDSPKGEEPAHHH